MNNSKTSKFDWNNFIQAMSNITNMPTVRDMLYENTKELHKKDIPSFKEQFIKKSREISYDERKELIANLLNLLRIFPLNLQQMAPMI